MKRVRLNVMAVVCLLVAGIAVAGSHTEMKDIAWARSAIKWEEGPLPGTKIAKLWGDWTKNAPYGLLIRFEGGLMHPLHHHTQNLKIVVLSGTFVHRGEDGVEQKLGPGSYLMQAGGKKHVSGCAAGAPCEFLMTSDGTFDMIPVESASK